MRPLTFTFKKVSWCLPDQSGGRSLRQQFTVSWLTWCLRTWALLLMQRSYEQTKIPDGQRNPMQWKEHPVSNDSLCYWFTAHYRPYTTWDNWHMAFQPFQEVEIIPILQIRTQRCREFFWGLKTRFKSMFVKLQCLTSSPLTQKLSKRLFKMRKQN